MIIIRRFLVIRKIFRSGWHNTRVTLRVHAGNLAHDHAARLEPRPVGSAGAIGIISRDADRNGSVSRERAILSDYESEYVRYANRLILNDLRRAVISIV